MRKFAQKTNVILRQTVRTIYVNTPNSYDDNVT